jgi:hypothetical protein
MLGRHETSSVSLTAATFSREKETQLNPPYSAANPLPCLLGFAHSSHSTQHLQTAPYCNGSRRARLARPVIQSGGGAKEAGLWRVETVGQGIGTPPDLPKCAMRDTG